VKVTADTITDEQIRRLLVLWGSMALDVRSALAGDHSARARCAVAINARHT